MLTSLEKIHPSLPRAAMRFLVAVDLTLGVSQRLGVGWTLGVRGCVDYLRCASALACSTVMPPAAHGAGSHSARLAAALATLAGWALFDAALAWSQNVPLAQIAACLGAALAPLIQRPDATRPRLPRRRRPACKDL